MGICVKRGPPVPALSLQNILNKGKHTKTYIVSKRWILQSKIWSGASIGSVDLLFTTL